MLRSVMVGLLSVILLGLTSSSVLAQRGAAAKALGKFGTGFYHSYSLPDASPGRAYSSGMTYASPVYSSGQTALPSNTANTAMAADAGSYRSFSYQPAPFETGQDVVVQRDATPVMLGQDTVGKLDAGQQFTVQAVSGNWLGVRIDQDGESLNGWVRQSDVAMHAEQPARPANASAGQAGDASAAAGYRSFSYQPAPVAAGQSPVVSTPNAVPTSSGYRTFSERANVSEAMPHQRISPPEVRLHPGSRQY